MSSYVGVLGAKGTILRVVKLAITNTTESEEITEEGQ